ncbi:putative transcription factor [Sesbania bispinosa]|nr:putative transcription factor [Sesbania bispinosa]
MEEGSERISEEWSCLSGVYTAEEADFMTHLLDDVSFSVPDNHAFWSAHTHHESTITTTTYPSTSILAANNNTNLFCFSQETSTDHIHIFPTTSSEDLDPPINFGSMGNSNTNYTSHNLSQHTHQTTDDQVVSPQKLPVLAFQPNLECEMLLSESAIEEDLVLDNPPKRFKSSITMDQVSENRKNAKSKKNPTSASNSMTMELIKRGASSTSKDSNCKSKPNNRGPATDPQSLYARVDISTMLEEAVQYVKFLQLQIKLLSSDDMWMYAPIAYNGINIGLDLNINSFNKTITAQQLKRN